MTIAKAITISVSILTLAFSAKKSIPDVPRSYSDTPKYEKVVRITMREYELSSTLIKLDSLMNDYGHDKLMSDVERTKGYHSALLMALWKLRVQDSIRIDNPEAKPVPSKEIAPVKEEKKQVKKQK